MIYFNNDYSEGCHSKVLDMLICTNMEQTPGYGDDVYCKKAADFIRRICENDALSVHFLVGGTQTNMTVIAAALRPHQGVICAESGHIHVHETGAVEATGHKILSLPSSDGKLTAEQIRKAVISHYSDSSAEHIVQPKMVYISNPTELGTLYSLEELRELSAVCRKHGLYLFMDGARLGYGLMAQGNDVTMEDIARLCDAFYIGGTKGGALFGEAVVFANAMVSRDFRYLIKQRGGMLAKGRLLGLQFSTLLEDGLYFELAKHANAQADKIRATLDELGYSYLVPGATNQIFPIFPNAVVEALRHDFCFNIQQKIDDGHTAVRFCTSWATEAKNVEVLCEKLRELTK